MEDHRQRADHPWAWPIADSLYMARIIHLPKNKTQLIDAEAYLEGWSENVYSSSDTRKLRKAIKQRRRYLLKPGCIPH